MEHLHSVYDSDTHFSINPITRVIRNESTKNSLVQYDHNSERFTFELPRYIEEHDMALCNKVEVHYLNIGRGGEQNADVYEVNDWQISPDDNGIVICSWLISANATQFAGSLNFLLRFACVADDDTIEYAWHTEIYSGISVSNGMNNGEAVITEYSDVLEAWKTEVLADMKEAVLYTEQTLTEEQKAQARKNIGATVAYRSLVNIASEGTFSSPFFNADDAPLLCDGLKNSCSLWYGSASPVNYVILEFTEEQEFSKFKVFAEGGTGLNQITSIAIRDVTDDENIYEICSIQNNGEGWQWFEAETFSEPIVAKKLMFAFTASNASDEGGYLHVGEIEAYVTRLDDYGAVDKKYVDDVTGDISTALDNILAIQESLVGGDSE